MTENINFIPANKLPVAEGNEVSVLCLENGEMKQKPANNLGGSIVVIRGTSTVEDTDGNFVEKFTAEPVSAGTYDVIKTGITTGKPVSVALIVEATHTNNDGTQKRTDVEMNQLYSFARLSGNPELEALAALLGVDEAIFLPNFGIYLLPDDRLLTDEDINALIGGDGE